jgi:2,3-bisphosphoglycerate-independent phosphoglycerate mutase
MCKYIMIVGDGMADYPLESLGGKTPLEAARIPNMDRLAREGAGGRLKTVPGGLTPSSDVANLSLLGYDPAKCYSGRGPLEAASLGINLEPDELAFRCNLVTVSQGKLSDYSAGHISTREAAILINQLEERLGGQGIRFYPGMSYRHLLVVKEQLLEDGRGKLKTVPPHDITGESLEAHLPRGKGGAFLTDLIRKSQIFLAGQEINSIRLDLGENPANSVWLWGEGRRPQMDGFRDRFGLSGALISAVDLLKGLARTIGMDVIAVPGATGFFDTDYRAKGEYALKALRDHDFVYVHVEAPDEAGHTGNAVEKVKAIEAIDDKIVGPALSARRAGNDLRVIVLPDHATPIALKTHVDDPIPFAVWGTGIAPDAMERYCEKEAEKGSFGTKKGHELLPLLFAL